VPNPARKPDRHNSVTSRCGDCGSVTHDGPHARTRALDNPRVSGKLFDAVQGVLAFATVGGFGWALGACWRGLLCLFWHWIDRSFWTARTLRPRHLPLLWLWTPLSKAIAHIKPRTLRDGLTARLHLGDDPADVLEIFDDATSNGLLVAQDQARGLILGGAAGSVLMFVYLAGGAI
jgi:hypothetical protein